VTSSRLDSRAAAKESSRRRVPSEGAPNIVGGEAMSLTKEYDTNMSFPNGATIQSHRKLVTGDDGITHVEEDVEVRGRFSETFVTGPAWMFELISLRGGSICFFVDGERIDPPAERFGLLFSAFSITDICFDNPRYHWCGFGDLEPFQESWMNRPAIFDMQSDCCPADARELAELLRAKSGLQIIEKNSCPSELSRKAKAIIDQTYNTEPSIAAAARRLGVSHPHLTRQFKKDYGLTPINYCHQLRASDAMTRLMMGERIIDISLDVGYNDLGRFYKQFRKATNSSPGLCRSMMDGKANRAAGEE
jgi:AraC-like DNA-binding protein